MTLVLITLAGSGLVGCFGSALMIDRAERPSRAARGLSRPRPSSVPRESAV